MAANETPEKATPGRLSPSLQTTSVPEGATVAALWRKNKEQAMLIPTDVASLLCVHFSEILVPDRL